VENLFGEKSYAQPLGYQREEGSPKRRGRPPKPAADQPEQPVSQPETTL
jgi:hypothetical protein